MAPGAVDIPILLYHHIGDADAPEDLYTVPAGKFQDQMERLRAWGYTPMRVSEMTTLLQTGGSLPLHPVIITFDDGYRDIFVNAFPVLKQLAFPATLYMIVRSIGAETNLDDGMIRALVQSGWEIGSHSYSHLDLTKQADLQKEVCSSRLVLQEISESEVKSFAYPYGAADEYLEHFVRDCGYSSGAGLGPQYRQTLAAIYYFQRLPVDGRWSLDEFSTHLPWQQP